MKIFFGLFLALFIIPVQSADLKIYLNQPSGTVMVMNGQKSLLTIAGAKACLISPEEALVYNDLGYVWIISQQEVRFFRTDDLMKLDRNAEVIYLRNFKGKLSGGNILLSAEEWTKNDIYHFWNTGKFSGRIVRWRYIILTGLIVNKDGRFFKANLWP